MCPGLRTMLFDLLHAGALAALVGQVDAFGNVLKKATVGYGRRQPDINLSPPDQLKQLQTLITYTENRVTNAIEATSPVNDRRRALRVRTGMHENGNVLIAVEDSGIGIHPDRLDRIFEPFFTTKSHGMGLGLWLCRRIVENHHGQLTASSDVGRGSRFEIALPKVNIAAAAASEAHARTSESGH